MHIHSFIYWLTFQFWSTPDVFHGSTDVVDRGLRCGCSAKHVRLHSLLHSPRRSANWIVLGRFYNV